MTARSARIESFRALHASGCFVIPNPWDTGSARWLRGLGFKALASTSAGFAFTQGRADQDVPLEMMLSHLKELCACVPDIPVNADFENAYADDPDGVARNVKACVATGVAGLSVEDASNDANNRFYPFDLAVERVKAARRAIDETGSGVLLTARAEALLYGGDFAEAERRIEAYAAAGADVLYAPGLKTLDQLRAIVAAAGGKPVNFLNGGASGLTVTEIAMAGARRISVGAGLARAAWAGFVKAAELVAKDGSFVGFAQNSATAALEPFFTKDLAERGGV